MVSISTKLVSKSDEVISIDVTILDDTSMLFKCNKLKKLKNNLTHLLKDNFFDILTKYDHQNLALNQLKIRNVYIFQLDSAIIYYKLNFKINLFK